MMLGGRALAVAAVALLFIPMTPVDADHIRFRIDRDGHHNDFEGYLACSLGTPVYRTVGCDEPTWIIGQPGHNDVYEFEIDHDPHGEVMVGLRWSATSDDAESLYMEFYDPRCHCSDTYKRVSGRSPVIVHVTQDDLQGGPGISLEFGVRVMANQGLVQEQPFELVTQEFWRGEVIPEGYDPFNGPA